MGDECLLSPFLLNNCTEGLTSAINQEIETKGIIHKRTK